MKLFEPVCFRFRLIAIWAVVVWIGLASIGGRLAYAQPPASQTIGLWVDATQTVVGVGDRSPFLKGLGEARSKLDRIVVTVFANGETVFPTKSKVFHQSLLYRTGKDPFADFLRQTDEAGIDVYTAFDLLQWVRPGAASSTDIFAHHPELQELNSQFGCRGIEEGKFASPFNPEVRSLLVQLVADFARRYPTIKGIVLNYRLSYGEVLGYSEAARVAYIRAKQIDPIDVILGSGEEKAEEYAREWYTWKRDEISRLVGEIAGAYKGVNPRGKVNAVGSANFYRQRLGIRNLTCQDWLDWMVQGYLDEVLLEERWSDPKNEKLWAGAQALVRKASKQAPLTPVLSGDSDLKAEVTALAGQSRPLRIVVAASPNINLADLINNAVTAATLLGGTNP